MLVVTSIANIIMKCIPQIIPIFLSSLIMMVSLEFEFSDGIKHIAKKNVTTENVKYGSNKPDGCNKKAYPEKR
jgi:hypothetical protein